MLAKRLSVHNYLLLCLLSVLAFATQLSAQALPVVLSTEDEETLFELKQTALDSSLSWELLESLTTEVGARRAGTAADQKAIAWAVEKMNSLGFAMPWGLCTRPPLTGYWGL